MRMSSRSSSSFSSGFARSIGWRMAMPAPAARELITKPRARLLRGTTTRQDPDRVASAPAPSSSARAGARSLSYGRQSRLHGRLGAASDALRNPARAKRMEAADEEKPQEG